MKRPLLHLLFVSFAFFHVTEHADAQVPPHDVADQRARLHFDSGRAHYEVGNYEAALHEFQAAYDSSHRAGILYNLYLCYERLSDVPRAIESLERFLAEGQPENRDVLEARLANLRARAARVAPERSSIDVARASEATDAHSGSDRAVPQSEPSRESDGSLGTSTVLAITAFSIAAAGLLTAAIAGGITLAEDARLDGCAPSCSEADTRTIGTTALMTDIGLGVAAAGAVVGLIGLLLPEDADHTDAETALVPMMSLEGAGLMVRGTL